jgi:hypothetical protein
VRLVVQPTLLAPMAVVVVVALESIATEPQPAQVVRAVLVLNTPILFQPQVPEQLDPVAELVVVVDQTIPTLTVVLVVLLEIMVVEAVAVEQEPVQLETAAMALRVLSLSLTSQQADQL